MDAAAPDLDPVRPGQRWVFRVRLPDGSATDVVGWVESVDEVIHVTGPGGGTTAIDRAAVILARRVPAAQGGPDPLRTSPAELQRVALPGWLGRHEPLGEWTLRAAGGFTGRANSCLAVGDPRRPLDQAAAAVVAWSAAHGIAPWAQVVWGSAEDEALRALGWQQTYLTTTMLVARLAILLGTSDPDPAVVVEEELSEAWLAAYGRSRRFDGNPSWVRLVLDGNPPRAFASVPGTPLRGIARGHLQGSWLGLTAIWVDPEHRRLGFATALMRALGHWAARRGARQVYLQVAAENTEAVEAYARLGFRPHHTYRYLTAPTP